jgi:hypothetical protein
VSQADEEQSPLPPNQEAELLEALEAALRPGELAPDVNERLIELALEDPLAPADEEELAESARLRDALERGTPHEDAGMLSALRAPWSAADEHESAALATHAALDAALGAASKPAGPRSNVVYAVFGAGSAILAAAAIALLFLPTLSRNSAPAASAGAAALVKPHSTAPLFTDRFETGETTARMDLIASARSRDLRDNRYAAWGVR